MNSMTKVCTEAEPMLPNDDLLSLTEYLKNNTMQRRLVFTEGITSSIEKVSFTYDSKSEKNSS